MSRAKGDEAESAAALFLRRRGFSIVDVNVHSRFGEIDIIASKEKVLHFVEVKSAPTYEQAVHNITPSKLAKIIKTSEIYMKKQGYAGDFTYDAVIVTPQQIELLEDITL